MAFLSQVPLDKLIRLKGEQSSNLGTIFGTRDYHKCDHCLGDSLQILCKLDNKVVNQLVWYTPWSRWSMTPIISPVLHMLKLPLPDGPTWAGGWVSRVLRWLFFVQVTVTGDPQSWKKRAARCSHLSSESARLSGIKNPNVVWGFLFGFGCFCCFLFGVWLGFFPPLLRIGAELYSLSLLSIIGVRLTDLDRLQLKTKKHILVPTWCKWRPTSQRVPLFHCQESYNRASTRHGRSIKLSSYWKKNRYSLAPTFKRSGNQNKNTNKTNKQKQKTTKTQTRQEPENTKGDWSCDLILIRLVAWCFLYVFDSHLSLVFGLKATKAEMPKFLGRSQKCGGLFRISSRST